MSNDLVPTGKYELSESDENLLRKTKCREANDEQWQLFKSVCRHLRLSPILSQIHAVFRNDNKNGGKTMTIQVGIDGYRLLADRTGTVIAGRSPTFEYDAKGNLLSATSYMKKLTSDGQWHEISATAYWSEYVQTYTDKNSGVQKPSGLWATMPRGQLAKCAESLAIRRASPYDEFALIRTDEEMEQADSEVIEIKADQKPASSFVEPMKSLPAEMKAPTISISEAHNIESIIGDDEEYKQRILSHYGAKYFIDIEHKHHDLILNKAKAYRDERLKKEMETV
jgi:phage recombination protein Bet